MSAALDGMTESIWTRRVGARMIDGFLIATFLLSALPGSDRQVLDLLAVALLDVVLLATWGTTPGKWLLGLRVVCVGDDGRPSWRQALVRSVALSAWPLAVLAMVVPVAAWVGLTYLVGLLVSIVLSPDGRGWHDRAAGTLVVRRA